MPQLVPPLVVVLTMFLLHHIVLMQHRMVLARELGRAQVVPSDLAVALIKVMAANSQVMGAIHLNNHMEGIPLNNRVTVVIHHSKCTGVVTHHSQCMEVVTHHSKCTEDVVVVVVWVLVPGWPLV